MGRKANHTHNRAGSKSQKGRKRRASNPGKVTPIKRASIDGGVTANVGEIIPHVFYLTVPCTPSKPWTENDVRPVYVFTGNDSTGAATAIWVCPFCELGITNRRTCEKHMGIGVMFSNVRDIACTVLREINSEREAFVRKNYGRIAETLQRTRKYKTIDDFIVFDLESEEYGDDLEGFL